MAYITDPTKKKQDPGQQGSVISEGGGGVAGSGAAAATAKTPTTAGTAGQWTNIQDFFGAQKGAPGMTAAIQKTGQEQLQKGKEESQAR